MKKIAIGIVIIAAILTGSLFLKAPTSAPIASHHAIISPTPTSSIAGVYSSTFPCGDCAGFKTELSLVPNGNNQSHGTYMLKETYEGKNRKPFETNGKWELIQGSPSNASAQVIQLKSDTSSEIQYYQLENANTLKYLDQNEKEIQSPFNLSLTKQ